VVNFTLIANKCFVEFSHADGLILLLSKSIMIVCSGSGPVSVVVVIGFYIFDVCVLPIRTVDILMYWCRPHFTKYALNTFICFIIDIVNHALGIFLAATYVTNYSCILHLFITDTIGKLEK